MRLLGQMISMAIVMVVFTIFIGREEISPTNYYLFLKSVKVSFIVFVLLCAIGVFFSFFRGELRSESQ
jgi:hypothetical protein